jgi:hypothetical protein
MTCRPGGPLARHSRLWRLAALAIACFTKPPVWTLGKPLGEPTIEIQHPTTNQTFSDGDALVAILLVRPHSPCDCQRTRTIQYFGEEVAAAAATCRSDTS